MDIDDFVYYKEKDKTCSLGLNINSQYFNNNISSFTNSTKLNNNKLSSLYDGLVIPSGLIVQNFKNNTYNCDMNNDGVIDDDIYNKLLNLASNKPNKEVNNKLKSNKNKSKKNIIKKHLSKKNKKTTNKKTKSKKNIKLKK